MTALPLNATEYGDDTGAPVAILHGLFGSGRNWQSIAQRLAVRRRVITLDLRNHGASPWSDAMDYRAMAEDVIATLHAMGQVKFALLGHSMGGKTAMLIALLWPEAVDRLVVVDIAPAAYVPRHLGEIEAMRGLDLSRVVRRSQADTALAPTVPDVAVRGFLLQNLAFPDGSEPRWRINLDAIEQAMPDLVGWPALSVDARYPGPALFVGGERSDYLRPEHEPAIRRLFPQARITTIPQAGHWVHAEQPRAFLNFVAPFLDGG